MTHSATDHAVIEAARAALSSLSSAERTAAAVPLFQKALLLDPSLADVHLALASVARATPELGVDIDAFNRTIGDKDALRNSYRDLLSTLIDRRQFDAAFFGQEELCRMFPETPDEKFNLALMLRTVGRKENAAIILADLMAQVPDNWKYRALFAEVCDGLHFSGFRPNLGAALLTCLGRIYEFDLLKFYPAWISLAFQNPGCKGLSIAAEKAPLGEAAFFTWLSAASPNALNFLTDEVFLEGLRRLLIPNPYMEKLLTCLRKWICLNAGRLSRTGNLGAFEDFLIALGEQCFFNEYVYVESDDERRVIDELVGAGISADTPRAFVALVSCYRSLLQAFPDQEAVLATMAVGSKGFAGLLKTQFLDPIEERSIAQGLRSFGTLDDRVSQAVRTQYEDNPYPRWVSANRYPLLDAEGQISVPGREGTYEILIAGCGTGKQVLNSLATYPSAKVTAIDISRASLAYAIRKVREAGLAAQVEFIQADILDMEHWDGQFDIVECAGVLHHMEDPFRGWQVLTDRLKPGGNFFVALYSETARTLLVEGQRLAKERSFPPTLEGIRAFRRTVLGLAENNPLRTGLASSGDFYATSAVRDLVFHVHERRFNLLQIQDMLERLGLQSMNFVLNNAGALEQFDRMFPQDVHRASLLNWHRFEQQFPETFAGMYQFWCRKPG